MSWRTVGILALACAAGLVILLMDRGDERGESPMFSFTTEDVDALMVVHGHDTTLVEKTGAAWEMVAPLADRADARAVGTILEQIRDMQADRSLEPDEGLAPFGLSPPELEILLQGRGTALARFAVGSRNPAGTRRYAHGGDTSVVLVVPDRIYSRLTAAMGDLRSRRLLQSETEEIVSLRRSGLGEPLSLTNAEGRWDVDAPVTGKADEAAVRSLLRRLEEPAVERFLPASGLTPGVNWIAETATGAETLGVFFDLPSGAVVRNNLRPDAMEVDSSLAALLLAPADTWRSRNLLPFPAYEVSGVMCAASSGETLSFHRDDRGRWRVGTHAADTQSVMRLVRDLEAAQVEFAPDIPDEGTHVMTIRVEDRNRESLTLQIGPLRAHGRVVMADHLGGRVYLASALPDTITLDERQWRSRRVVEVGAYEVEGLEVRIGGVSAKATRRGFDGWKTTKHWVEGLSPDSLLEALLDARIERFTEEIEAGQLREMAALRLVLDEDEIPVVLFSSGDDSSLVSIEGGPLFGIEDSLLPLLRGSSRTLQE